MPDPFKFELVSPARLVVSGDVEQVLVPGSEGDFTVLAYHAPVLTTLRPGVVDIVTASGESVRYFVRGGFAEVGPAGLTILAETAVDLAEMDASDLVQSIENAEEDVQDAKDDLARDRAQTKLDQLRQVQGALNL